MALNTFDLVLIHCFIVQHYHQQRERLMRQMWNSEQQWNKENAGQQQRFNDERDEGGGGGYDHWEREDDEGDEEGFDLTPKHKIRTPIMEETESSVEQALRSRVGSRRLRRENIQGREGEGGDREGMTRTRMDEEEEEGGVDEEDMKLSLAENVSASMPSWV